MTRRSVLTGLLRVGGAIAGLGGVAACAQEDDVGPLEQVEVTGDFGRRPQVIAPTPLSLEHTDTITIIPGDGRTLEDGDPVLVAYLAIDAETGETVDDSYSREPRVLLLSRDEAGLLYDSLLGAREGTRLLRGDAATIARPHPTLLVFDALRTRAWGESVPAPADADTLPTVTRGEDGAPAVTIPEDEPPGRLEVVPLIRGDGPQVRSGGMLTVQYTSVAWGSGEVLETTWNAGNVPQTMPFTGLIPGWQEGLSGATVGSQYMIVAPAEDAFGVDTVVFVIDVLATSISADPTPTEGTQP